MEIGYFYAAVTILFGFLLTMIARFIVSWLKSQADTTDTRLDDIIIAAIGKPLQVTIIAVSFYIALKYYGIVPVQYQWVIDDRFINSFYIIIGAWVISSFLHDVILIYGHAIVQKSENDWDDRLIELLELVAKYVIWFVAIILILYTFKIDITPFLAGAGIAGLAIALAAQDKFGDFGLKFVLYVWAKAYNLPDEVMDAVNSQIAERFATEGIEIPFPQMDVRMRK
jgi:MscS family membrane protein